VSPSTDPVDVFTGKMDYPLVVITTISEDGERSGCLAGFVTQCSIDPPRFLVCVSRVNHTFDTTRRARLLALHVLGADQVDMASHFGEQTGDSVDKFVDVGWHPGLDGVPVLDDCAAWLIVEILDRFDVGDHQALLTGPREGGVGNRSGLLTVQTAPALDAGHPVD